MKEILESDILRLRNTIAIPDEGIWEVLLLCEVELGEAISFHGQVWRVEYVYNSEFCGSFIYQVKLSRETSCAND